MTATDFDISGKVILITGCNGLLGRSLVEECLKNNAKVAGLDLEASHNMAFDKNENLSQREKEVLKIYKSFNTANKHKMDPIPVCKIPKDYL